MTTGQAFIPKDLLASAMLPTRAVDDHRADVTIATQNIQRTGVDQVVALDSLFEFHHSPFTRSVNLEQTLQLTGMAYVNGHPVATVLNKQTKERVLVFEEPNALGWQLLAASAGADLSNSQIEMRVGPETITMHYHGQEVSTGMDGKGGSKSRLAGSGSKKEGDKPRASSFLGEQGREMYASLSPEARDKFKDLMKSRQEKHPELTPEQNLDYAQKVFVKLKATDPASAGGGEPRSAACRRL